MKTAFLLLALFALPVTVLAHGGVAQNIGSTTIFLKQDPLSPLADETVTFSFAFSAKDTNQPLKDLDVELKVIDTFTGDESKDTVVFTEQYRTDANGNFAFQYAFPEENFFDVELTFTDPASSERETAGFLVQPRETHAKVRYYAILLAFAAGYGIAYMLSLRTAKK